MNMNRLIIILSVLVVVVMIYLTYALGGFDWMKKGEISPQYSQTLQFNPINIEFAD